MGFPKIITNNINSPVFIIVSMVTGVFLLAISLSLLLTANFLYFLVSVLILSAFVYFYLSLYKIRRNMQSDEIANEIYGHIIKNGIRTFDLSVFRSNWDVSENQFFEGTKKAYKQCILLATRDFKISDNERRVLTSILAKLEVSEEDGHLIEKDVAKEIYRKELKRILDNGLLTENKSKNLLLIRNRLGLSVKDAYEGSQKEVLDGYKKLFNDFFVSGTMNNDDCDELLIYHETTGLDPAHAAKLAPDECENLYSRAVAIICRRGVVSDQDISILDKLEKYLEIPYKVTHKHRSAVQKIQELENISKGKLPVVDDHGLQLNPSEICYWDSKCQYTFHTPTQQKHFDGRIVVTDRRFMFLSEKHNFEAGLRRVINLNCDLNGVEIECTSNRGKGFYKVHDPQKFKAILYALTKRIKLFASEDSDSDRNRHIPDDIKASVWQRDAGRCVNCGAEEYLEFDHIIPFSRGGANSLNNVQLLCRKCNLAKGAELF